MATFNYSANTGVAMVHISYQAHWIVYGNGLCSEIQMSFLLSFVTKMYVLRMWWFILVIIIFVLQLVFLFRVYSFNQKWSGCYVRLMHSAKMVLFVHMCSYLHRQLHKYALCSCLLCLGKSGFAGFACVEVTQWLEVRRTMVGVGLHVSVINMFAFWDFRNNPMPSQEYVKQRATDLNKTLQQF